MRNILFSLILVFVTQPAWGQISVIAEDTHGNTAVILDSDTGTSLHQVAPGTWTKLGGHKQLAPPPQPDPWAKTYRQREQERRQQFNDTWGSVFPDVYPESGYRGSRSRYAP